MLQFSPEALSQFQPNGTKHYLVNGIQVWFFLVFFLNINDNFFFQERK